MIKNILTLIAVFSFSVTLLAQNNYYVSNSGNDSNPGTMNSPWKTISKVNSVNFNNGDKISFKGGDKFFDAILKIDDPDLTISSFGEGRAILGDSLGNLKNTILITADGITVENLYLLGSSVTNSAIVKITGNDFIIRNNIIDGGRGTSNGGYGVKAIFINGGIVEENEVFDLHHGISFTEPKNVEVRYNKIHDLYNWDKVANRSLARANGGGTGIGLSVESFANGAYDCGYGVRFHHNEIYNFEYTAFKGSGYTNYIIEYNNIHSNLDETIYRGGVKHGTVGKIFDDTGDKVGDGGLGVVVRYNVIHDIRRVGKPGYYYAEDGTILVAGGYKGTSATATNPTNNANYPVYQNSGVGGTDFGDDWGEVPDHLIGGLGYGNNYTHNNIIYNIDHAVWGRGTHFSRNDNPAYKNVFAYNTVINSYKKWWTSGQGMIYQESGAPSTLHVKNNVLDFAKENNKAWTIYYSKTPLEAERNVYCRRAGYIAKSSSDYTR